MTRLNAFFAALIGLMLMTTQAVADRKGPPAPSDVAKIDVLPGWRDASGHHVAALRIRLAEGWKTYWRAPGQAGIPPSINWTGSGNLAGVAFHWPVPEVFTSSGMRTIGYTQDLILPMTLTPRTKGGEITLNGEITLGVCRDICMPMKAHISVTLPNGASGPKNEIKRALRERPDTQREAGLKRAICQVEPMKDGLRLTAHIDMPRVGPGEVVVVETPDPSVWVSDVSTKRDGGTLTTVAELVPLSGKPFLLNRSDIRMTVLAAGRGVDIRGCTGG